MTTNERVRILRKERLKMTLDAFGKRVGVTKAAISDIERGRNNVTDQMFTSICREFNVNEAWLRTGEGEMFRETRRDKQIQAFIDEILTDEPEGPKARLVAALADLDERGWEMLVSLAKKMVAENQASAEMQMEEKAHADLQRSMDEKKQAEEGSSASSAV